MGGFPGQRGGRGFVRQSISVARRRERYDEAISFAPHVVL
jgi:hypothetical protein